MSHRSLVAAITVIGALGIALTVPGIASASTFPSPPCPPHSVFQPDGSIEISLGCATIIRIPLGK